MSQDLTVVYKGNGCRLNARLIQRQGLTEPEVDYIKHLHMLRMEIEEYMRTAPTAYILKGFNECWMDIQRMLQDAWKFDQNDNFIRFWEVPRCSCPKMDNSDNFPLGYYITNQDCEVHGWEPV